MAHSGVVLPPTVRSRKPHSCEEGGCQMQPRFHVSTRTLLTYPCKASLRRTLRLCACMSALPFAARVATRSSRIRHPLLCGEGAALLRQRAAAHQCLQQ